MKPPNLIAYFFPAAGLAMFPSLLAFAASTATACCQIVEIAADVVTGPRPSSPIFLTEFNGALYFTATDSHGKELWEFDGTTASLVVDFVPGIDSPGFRDFTVFGGNLYFYGAGLAERGIYKFDGSGISLAAAVNPGTVTGGTNFIEFDGKMYFESRDFSPGNRLTGSELWKFDGTTASLAADIRLGPDNSNPNNFAVYHGDLYFSARSLAPTGYVLWKYDGTTASIASNVGFPGFFGEYDGNLYFRGEDAAHGSELWEFDGTTASVIDIRPGSDSSSPVGFTVYDGNLYFSADGGAEGRELWKYDGTTASLVADLNPSPVHPQDSNPSGLTVLNSILYFAADDGVHGSEMWKYDGTTASLVSDIYPGPTGSFPRNFALFDASLYFRANDGVKGEELWRLIPDADGDGVPDSLDPFPDSDLRFTVFVGDIDTGVYNDWLPDGSTVADLVNSAPDGPGISGLVHVLNTLRKDGWITGKDKAAILKAYKKT